MRKLLGAALALACLLSPALAQQLPTENAFTGRYNASLPTFASGQIGPLAVDANGRLILAPTTSVTLSNFPAVQAVSQSGAFTVTQGPAGAAAWKVDGSAVTQPISAASLPLPAGAATAASQATANATLSSIDTKTPTLVNGRQPVDGSGVTQPISGTVGVSSLPVLPAGANTIGAVNVLGGNAIAVKTDGSAVTQPVSAAALPLPTGAATAAKQPSLGTAGTPSADVLTVQGNASGTPLPVSATLNGGTSTVFLAAGSQAIGSLAASSTGASGATFGTYYTAATAAAGQVIKGAPGNVFNLTAWNSDTAAVWVKLFNKASAPTMGTDSAVWEAMVPAGGTISVPFADIGLSLGTGIAIGFSGAQGATNATALNAAGKAGVSIALK